MATPLRLDVAALVGLTLQSFFYGIFQVLFIGCVYVLLHRRASERINWHFLVTAILMWILIGINFALSWSRILDAFIDLQPAFREDASAIVKYLSSLSNWKEVARNAVYVTLTAVADTLFIYRCYVVWGCNRYIIALPTLLLCGTVVSGIAAEVIIGTTKSGPFASSLASWVTAFYSISLVQNVITTLLIVYRIWSVNAITSRGTGARSLWPVMAVVLESGAIYSSTLFVLLITYVVHSFAQNIAMDILVPIIGITFNLIIVRVGLGLSSGGRSVPSTQPSSGTFPLQKLNINVSRNVTVDRDMERGQSNNETKVQHYADSDPLNDSIAWKQPPAPR